MSEESYFLKKKIALRSLLAFSLCEDAVKGVIYEGDSLSPDTQSSGISILDFSASRNMKTKSMLSISYPVYGNLL